LVIICDLAKDEGKVTKICTKCGIEKDIAKYRIKRGRKVIGDSFIEMIANRGHAYCPVRFNVA